jgi:Tfp pilus assembly protein PilO
MVPMSLPRSFGMLAAVAMMTVAYFALIFVPNQRALRQLRQQTQQEQRYVEANADLPQQVAGLRDRLREVQAYVEAHEARAPKNDGLGSFYDRFTQAATQAEVTLAEITPAAARNGKLLRELPVVVRCSGKFHSLGQLLARLDGFPDPLAIEELTLEATPTDSEKIACTINITVFRQFNENSD